MKVLGFSSKGKILEVSNDEMAHLMGSDDYVALLKEKGKDPVPIGAEIHVSDIYSKIRYFERNKDFIAGLSKKLQDHAAQLNTVEMVTLDVSDKS